MGLYAIGLDKTRKLGMNPEALTPTFGRADNKGALEKQTNFLAAEAPHSHPSLARSAPSHTQEPKQLGAGKKAAMGQVGLCDLCG